MSRADARLLRVLRATAAVAAGVVLLIGGFVAVESGPALRHVGPAGFVTGGAWHPTEGRYDLSPMLAGTLLVTAGAVALAAPLGVLSAVFCHSYAPAPLARAWRRAVELMAGVPSVVYGLWGLVVLVPLVARIRPPGASLLAGVAILTLMVLPTMALLAEASLAALPREYLHGAAALGLSRSTTVFKVLLPAARSGVLTGAVLQTGRAAGETMAVLMVCGNVVQVPGSLFEPVRTLTANIALEMAYALGDHRSALFVSGLVLLLLVAALALAADWLQERGARA